jgi:hypothetical protein
MLFSASFWFDALTLCHEIRETIQLVCEIWCESRSIRSNSTVSHLMRAALWVVVLCLVCALGRASDAPSPQDVACQAGFHRVGLRCVQDELCIQNTQNELQDSCSGHGVCNDKLGWPQCTCFAGFASSGVCFIFLLAFYQTNPT